MEEEKKSGNKTISIIILVVGMIIAFVCGFLLSGVLSSSDNKTNNTNENANTNTNTNTNANTNTNTVVNTTPEPLVDNEPIPDGYDAIAFYGKATVRGYVTVEEVEHDDVHGPVGPDYNPEKYEMVVFHIEESDNNKFLKFLETYGSHGNTFAKEKAFSIGCVEDGKLWHYNDSDEFGMKQYSLNETDTSKIMNSKKDSLITLEIERYKFTSGGGAPKCYSHISTIAIKE